MKYFLIAGEASGDMHAAELMEALKVTDREALFEFCGGDLMQAAGGKLHIHYREMAFMGIMPVLMNLPTIARNLKLCQQALLNFNPDVVILIDYPGFNLRMARFSKKHGFKTVYYISPKIWAWKTGRVKKVKAFIDQMLTIFPFETSFYEKYRYQVEYVGNPLYDKMKRFRSAPFNRATFIEENHLDQRPIIALLPGSRYHEVTRLLEPMIETSRFFPGYQFVVAGFQGLDSRVYQPAISNGIKIVFNQTYELLVSSSAALTASGTATLETALLKVPQVVCYKMSPAWIIEKFRPWVLKTKYFSLVNLIADEEVVTELFQSTVTPDHFQTELEKILNNTEHRNKMIGAYHDIEMKLETEGAAARAAQAIVYNLSKSNKK